MSKKLMVIGDIQSDDKNPKSRKDDYLLAILTKLDESFEMAKRKKVDAVILLGDVFEKIDPPGRCRNAMVSLFMEAKKSFPLYVVIGNHDIKSSMANYASSALGTLIESGVLIYTDYEPSLGIRFGHYTPTIESDIKSGVYSGTEAFIWAFHANISTAGMPFEHVLFKDTKWHESCKLVISGHLHKRMEGEKNGVQFINPGPIIRDELSDYNMTFNPGVLFVEYELNDHIIKTEIVNLKKVAPASEVFYVDEYQEKKDIAKDTHQYIQQISHMNSWVSRANKIDSLKQSAVIKKIEPDVLELALKTLEEVNSK